MRLAGRILLLAIILICIGKFLRYNRYDGCIPESVALVKADSGQMEEARFFDFCGEAARLYRLYLYKAYSADYRKPVIKSSSVLRESYLDILRQPSAIACFAVYIIALIISWL